MVVRMKGRITECDEVSAGVVDFDIDPERRPITDDTSHPIATMG